MNGTRDILLVDVSSSLPPLKSRKFETFRKSLVYIAQLVEILLSLKFLCDLTSEFWVNFAAILDHMVDKHLAD